MEYTDETYMVFGQQLVNPYSIPVMTQAYNAYFAISLTTVPVTHRYLGINTISEAQIAMLDDSLELDLYTHPNGNHPSYTHVERPCAPTEIIGIEDDPCPDPGAPAPPLPPPTVCGLLGLSCVNAGYPRGRIRV